MQCSHLERKRQLLPVPLGNALNDFHSFIILLLSYEPPGRLRQTPATHTGMTATGEENAHYWYLENENGTELPRLGSYGALSIFRQN